MTQNSAQYFHSVEVFQVHYTSAVLCNRTVDLGKTILMVDPAWDSVSEECEIRCIRKEYRTLHGSMKQKVFLVQIDFSAA